MAHLTNGATTLMFEGVPTYPVRQPFWQICEKHKVNQFTLRPNRHSCVDGKARAFVDGMRPEQPESVGHRKVNRSPRSRGNWLTNDVVGKGNCPPSVDTCGRPRVTLIDPATAGHMQPSPGAAMKPFLWLNSKPVVLARQRVPEIDGKVMSRVFCVCPTAGPAQNAPNLGRSMKRFDADLFAARLQKAITSPAMGVGGDADGAIDQPAAWMNVITFLATYWDGRVEKAPLSRTYRR